MDMFNKVVSIYGDFDELYLEVAQTCPKLVMTYDLKKSELGFKLIPKNPPDLDRSNPKGISSDFDQIEKEVVVLVVESDKLARLLNAMFASKLVTEANKEKVEDFQAKRKSFGFK